MAKEKKKGLCIYISQATVARLDAHLAQLQRDRTYLQPSRSRYIETLILEDLWLEDLISMDIERAEKKTKKN